MNKSVNLLDSLDIVTSDKLLRDLLKEVAPDLVYDWDATAHDQRERSIALFSKLQEFQRHHPTQHCNLTTQLSTIALINAAQNGSYLKSQIEMNPFLHKRIGEYPFELHVNRHLASTLATWLLLQTLTIAKNTAEHERATKLWDEVVTMATKWKSKVHYRSYQIEEPTVRNVTDWDKNVNEKYLDYLRLLLLSRRVNPDEPVPVGYIRQPQEHYIQFFFKIPKYPHLSSQVRQDGKGYETGRDMNADSIEIQFYPNINIVRVSDESEISNSETAKHFIADVLGTRIDNSEKNKVYTHILERFKTKDFLSTMRNSMTAAAKEAKAEVWIEEMDFSYGAKLIDKVDPQQTFQAISPAEVKKVKFLEFPPMTIHSCDSQHDVYDILDRSFKDEFTADTRTIHRIKLIVKLRYPLNWGDERIKKLKSEFAEYAITISDTKRKPAYPPETPIQHKAIIDGLIQGWKLTGIPKANLAFYTRGH